MSDLPGPVAEAGLLFRQTAITNDAEAMHEVIIWGHQQIDISYPEDPIPAPLNIVRRKLAHMEWDRVIRAQGRELRVTIASQIVRDLEFAIKRRQDQILREDAEKERQKATKFDSGIRIDEHESISDINLRLMEAQLRLTHELNEKAEDAASARRIKERINDTQQEIAKLTAEAIVKAMGGSSAEETIKATRLVNDEISRIRNNPNLTEDDKHIQIRTLLETLPHMLRNVRPQDV
ncbi:MAG: hypothetical protein M3457_14065 [Chloroflexota bacterium]|nr:hypothetical protein [Chloroflexota bacterium]